MKEEMISVTDAARNFADCVNRVHYQGASFVLLKNGKAMAKLVPVEKRAIKGRELAEVIRKTQLTSEEAKSWKDDIKTGHKHLIPPSDKWE